MGTITTRIRKKCRYRNTKTESAVKRLTKLLPLLSANKQSDYDIVYDWLLELRDDIYCSPAITSKEDFYMNRIIELNAFVFQDRSPDMEHEVARNFYDCAKNLLDKNPVTENRYINPDTNTASIISIFKYMANKEYLSEKNIEDSLSEMTGIMEEAGFVTTDEMKKRIRENTENLLKNFDRNAFLEKMKTVCSGDEHITELLTQNEELVRELISSAMAEYVLLEIAFREKLSGNERTLKNNRVHYLNQFLKRICYKAWDELIRLKFKTEQQRIEKKIKSCISIMDDRAFLQELQNDFSIWTRIGELIMKPEYYRTALSYYKQINKKEKTEGILESCKEKGTVPDNEVIKSLICAAVNNMDCLSPYDLKEYRRTDIYGPFDTTILQKNGGWFMGDIQTLPKNGSVSREHVFIIAFALQLSVDDAETLLLDGAKQEGFDSKCLLEAIYPYCLNWKLSYADARRMWLDCIEMLLYNDKSAGFCRIEETVQDDVYTEEMSENINDFLNERDEKTDRAFLDMLAGCSKLSIEELSEWIVWKYMAERSFDDKIKSKLVQWIGESNYNEILNKLHDTAEKLISATHKAKTLASATDFIQKLLEKTYKNTMRVIRLESASSLYSKLSQAWVEIVNAAQSQVEIENRFLNLQMGSIEKSGEEAGHARYRGESLNKALSKLIEGEYPITVKALGSPLTAELLTEHENGQLPVTRTDILRYSFWISLLSRDNYGKYDPDKAFPRFQTIANRYLAECRYHQFYVRSALDRVLYMCFWDDCGPIEAYRRIIGRLRVLGDYGRPQRLINKWKASIEDSGDEEYRKAAVGEDGQRYMKAIIWLSYKGVFDGSQTIWPQLAAFELASREEDPDRVKENYEKDKAKQLQKIEEAIQKCDSRKTDIEKKYKEKTERAKTEMQIQSFKEAYEKESESIRIKLEELERNKAQWLSDEILSTRIEEMKEYCRNYTGNFIQGCKEYFLRFFDELQDWYIAMEKAYPPDRIEAMKKELETTG